MKLNIGEAIAVIENTIKRITDKKAVIGISGGIDSAVVASLCTRALGRERVVVVQMPYGEQSTKDGSLLIESLGLFDAITNIKPIVDVFEKQLPLDSNRLINGNMRARVRMTILYALAGSCNGLVMGTSNKTEIELGYFTKFGDGGCDVEPIGDLYKTEVFEMAKELKIPESIINKKPSAELWEGQTDEGEIGMTYEEMDQMLREEPCSIACFKAKYGEKGDSLIKRKLSTNHKRVMPPVFKVDTARSF